MNQKLDEPGILNKIDDMRFSSRNRSIEYQICDYTQNFYQYILDNIGYYIDCPYFRNQEDHENFWNEFKIACYSDGQVMLKRNKN
ncbi:MAG: hypothetical protein ACKPHV_09505 [Microcystis panniformis]